MADLSDTLDPSGSSKEVKPSIPDPIPSQVLKSEYMEDISKVTSIFMRKTSTHNCRLNSLLLTSCRSMKLETCLFHLNSLVLTFR